MMFSHPPMRLKGLDSVQDPWASAKRESIRRAPPSPRPKPFSYSAPPGMIRSMVHAHHGDID